MKKYEIMYILKPNLEDAERNELIGKLHESFKIDGTIENIDEWGLRDLAYEIKDEKKGYYVVVTISASSTKGLAGLPPTCSRHNRTEARSRLSGVRSASSAF